LKYQPDEQFRKHLNQQGIRGKKFRLDAEKHAEVFEQFRRWHPEETEEQLHERAAYFLIWKHRKKHNAKWYLKWLAIGAALLLLILGASSRAEAQVDCIKVQDSSGTTVGNFCSPFKIKAGSNIDFTKSGTTVTINSSAAAAGAGGSDTQLQYNSSGTVAGTSGATWNSGTSTLSVSSLLAKNLNTIRLAEQFAGTDCSDKINAADADLGSNAGEIWVTANCTPTSLNSVVTLSANHLLRFLAGAGTFTSNRGSASNTGNIVMKNSSSLVCDDWNTILQESSNSGTRQTIVSSFTAGHSTQSSDLHIIGCHFQGANPVTTGSPATVELNNCLRCSVERVWLENTVANGVTVGGPSGTTFADDDWVVDSLFTGVAAQAVAVVNGKNVHINRNIFRDPGQGTSVGTQVDVEPNVNTDLAENIDVSDNIFDFRGETVGSGAWGIFFQKTTNTTRSGPFSATNNLFIGGTIAADGAATSRLIEAIVCTGGTISGSSRDCIITGNTIINSSQAPIALNWANRALISNNKILCNADGTNGGILLRDSFNSDVMGNVIAGDGTCGQTGAKGKIVEQNTSDNNRFIGNTVTGVTIVGANSWHWSNDFSGNATTNMPLVSTAKGTFGSIVDTSTADMTEIAAPSNPSAGLNRLYGNSTSHTLKCLTSAGNSCFPASTVLADFSTTAASTSGKIPIYDTTAPNAAGGTGAYVPGDPLVQGVYADLSTLAANPVAIGGYDTAGTPVLHKAVELNSHPAVADYGLVVRNIPAQPSTSSVTSVNDTASSTTLLSSNTSRRLAIVFNDSTSNLYLKFGATASATSFTVKIAAGATFEFPQPVYTGVIDGIWDSDSSGAARITELTP
jgi:hypothetical protein